jgi:hypothetical protein
MFDLNTIKAINNWAASEACKKIVASGEKSQLKRQESAGRRPPSPAPKREKK